MQKQETRPNTQYENMIQYQIRKVVIDPPKTQDLISNKYDIIPYPQPHIRNWGQPHMKQSVAINTDNVT